MLRPTETSDAAEPERPRMQPMTGSRFAWRVLALALVALTLFAPAQAAAQAPEQAHAGGRRVRLQLKWFHQFQFAGYYAARDRGYYAREGLDVELIEGGKDRPPVAAVLGGQAEFGVHDGADVLQARLKGAPVVAVAAVFQHSPYVIVSLQKTGIRKPADLIGRDVMLTNEQSPVDILAMLAREGVKVGTEGTASAVHVKPQSWRLDELIDGRVAAMAAYSTDEPMELTRRGYEVAQLRPIDYGVDFYGDTLFTTETLAAKEPELIDKFREASMRGWEYAMHHSEEIAGTIQAMPSARDPKPSRQALLDEARALEGIVLPALVSPGNMNPARWESMAGELVREGIVHDASRLNGFAHDPQAEQRATREILRQLAYGLGGAVLIALASLLWVHQLRRKVRRRTAALEREVALREEKSRALEAAEQKTRAILAALPDLVFVINKDGTFVEHHSRTTTDLAVPPELFLGKKIEEVLPPSVSEPLRNLVETTIRTGETGMFDYPLEVAGERRFFEARMVRLGSDQAVTLVRNITDEKRDQDRLATLAAAVEQAAEDFIITDADGMIQYVNPAFERTTGYTSEEVLGRPPSLLRSGKHDEEFYDEILTVVAQGGAWNGRITNRTKSGKLIQQDATVGAIRDPFGRPMGYVSSRRDVTRQAELEAHLSQSQKMEAIGTLAGGIAHDFNNVLAGVIGYAELALENEGNPETTADDLHEVLRAAYRAVVLVKQILAFSRGIPEEAHPVRVVSVVKEATKFLRATIPSSVELQFDPSSQSDVLADPGDIQRIILNLCTNASLAIGETAGHLHVRVADVELQQSETQLRGELPPGRYVQLTVSDDGCGMAPEVKARIFEPFFTTRRSSDGTGLGLSVVHGIVKNRGGAVRVESEPGKGSRFDVFLPVFDTTHAEPEPAPEPPKRGGGRILFVDDEQMVVSLFRRALERLGYEVDGFTSSSEALKAFEEDASRFQLVVTDLAMPKLRGDELAKRLKSIRPEVPILLCTGNDQGLTPEFVSALGIARVLHKPMTVTQVAGAIYDAMEHSRVAVPPF